jgi:ABC-type Zn uptake system ZnuABC Zn-binding protein ZnuA
MQFSSLTSELRKEIGEKGMTAIYIIVTVLTSMAFGLGGLSASAGASDRLPVAVSILPLADFTRNVGADRVEITVLVPPGSSPHTYEPAPSRARSIADARVVVLNGVGLEFWAKKLVDAANNPDLIVVETAEGLDVIEDDEDHGHEGEGGEHRHEKGNPHVWLDPLYAIHQVKKIRDALIQADPGGAEIYRDRADRYIQQLIDLDREIREVVAGFRSREFISFHAGYDYFARRYGLEQVAVVERTPGREPSPNEIAAIVRTAKEFGVRAIFAEPQFPPKAARVIAEECGAQVLFLNPLGSPPDYAYIDMMRANLRELERGLGEGG